MTLNPAQQATVDQAKQKHRDTAGAAMLERRKRLVAMVVNGDVDWEVVPDVREAADAYTAGSIDRFALIKAIEESSAGDPVHGAALRDYFAWAWHDDSTATNL